MQDRTSVPAEPISRSTSTPAVSITIPTYEREEELCHTLRCALAQSYSRLEILVVDQASAHTERTEAFFAANAGRIRHIRTSVVNLPTARNLGVEHATGELIIFVDDDVSFDPNFVENHVEYYLEDPQIGGVAGHVRAQPPAHPYNPKGRYVKSVWGCNMSFRRQAVMEVGGFDPRFSGNAMGEENDFAYRLHHRGYRIANGSHAVLLHYAAPRRGMLGGTEYRNPRWLEDYFRNIAFCFAKRFPGARWLLPLFVIKNWRTYWRHFRAAAHKPALLRLLWQSHRDALRLARQPAPSSFLSCGEG